MYYDIQDALTESTHVRASSIICPKVALAVTIVSHCMCRCHRLHVMFMMLHLRLHYFSHVASEARSGYYNNSRFACNRGGNDGLHGARSALGRAMQLWVAIVPAPFSVEPGPMRNLPANVAERMLTPSGLL